MKRSDVPVVDVLRAYRDYRAEMDAALAKYNKPGRLAAFAVIMADSFPRPARPWERVVAAGFPYKVVMARIRQLDRMGLLDYGVSLEVGWLTDAGRKVLEDAERVPQAEADARG